MKIRKAKLTDLERMNEILKQAKQFLKDSGSSQWQSGEPSEALLQDDIRKGISYVLIDEHDQVLAFAVLLVGSDPNYAKIWDGKWLTNTDNYVAIHRVAIAQDMRNKGLGTKFLKLLVNEIKQQGHQSARIDTFRLNQPMQHVALNVGFKYCGKINVVDPIDPERYAYELVF